MKTLIKSIRTVVITALMLALCDIQPAYAASIVVNTNADNTTAGDGFCTLREAINNANNDSDTTSGDCVAGAGADTISFAGNYTITLAGSQLPVVTTTITINGISAANTILQANANPNVATNRIFEVASTGNLTLNNLTIRNGQCNGTCPTNNAIGGGINNNGGKLTVANSTLSNNSATLFGGGIFNSNGGTLTVTNSVLSTNSASIGGGIFNFDGTLTVTNSTFSANSAINSGGGAISNGSGTLDNTITATVTNSTLSNNSASSGGGINNNGGALTVTNSTFSSNSAAASGGGILNYGTSKVINSTLSANSASNGGGIYNSGGTLMVVNSAFTTNSVINSGGGIYNNFFGTLMLTNSIFSANSATDGGGIYNSGKATVANSTFSVNTASNYGGGIDSFSADTLMVNSTFSTNSATNGGGGIFNAYRSTKLDNVIIANSSSGSNCYQLGGILTADNFNIDTDGSCDNATQATSAQLNLQPLADNGGPTQTMALGAGSVALDTGDAVICANAPVSGKDQRGVTRPQGAGCDVGAYELDDAYPIVVSESLVANYIIGPNSFTVTFSENVYDPAGDTDTDDVTNPNNYLLIKDGANRTFNTTSCASRLAADDIQVTVDSVTYNSNTYTSTVNINSGAVLPNGKYRLFVCGTTSIVDIALNPLNNGVSDYTFDFTIAPASSASSLPKTGFAPNRSTSLSAQPADLAYNNLGDLWLEIPSLNVKTEIIGVPQSAEGWNVDWLGNSAGWLNGTAFPSWEGNSIITAHVTDSNGLPGPFANIKDMKYGDQIIVHMYGEKYTFEVRNSDMVFPSSTKSVLEHLDGHSYLTLITCQWYNPITDSYAFRRVVRAVLVNVQSE